MGGWLTTVVGRVCIDMLRARLTPRGLHRYLAAGAGRQASTTMPTLRRNAARRFRRAGAARRARDADALRAPRVRPARHVRRPLRRDRSDGRPDAGRHTSARQPGPASRAGRGADADADLAASGRSSPRTWPPRARGTSTRWSRCSIQTSVFRADTGGRPNLAPAQLKGASEVAKYAVARGARFAPYCRPALVNGSAGLIAETHAGLIAVVGFTVTDGRITTIDLVLDPDKLPALVPGE